MKKIFDKALSSLYKNDRESFNEAIVELDDINYQDKDGRSLLIYAVLENDIDLVEALINRGAKVNLNDNNGWTALHFAANEHLVAITKLLIKKGADVNAKDSYGNTVIWRAVFASKGRGEIIELLLDNGADPSIVNDSDVSALSLADTIGNYDVSQFFRNA